MTQTGFLGRCFDFESFCQSFGCNKNCWLWNSLDLKKIQINVMCGEWFAAIQEIYLTTKEVVVWMIRIYPVFLYFHGFSMVTTRAPSYQFAMARGKKLVLLPVSDLHSKILDARPPFFRSNFLHFHSIFGKFWPNNRLALPFWGVAPSVKSWIRRCLQYIVNF